MITSVTNVTAARLGATKNQTSFQGSFIGFDEVMRQTPSPVVPKKGLRASVKDFFAGLIGKKQPSGKPPAIAQNQRHQRLHDKNLHEQQALIQSDKDFLGKKSES